MKFLFLLSTVFIISISSSAMTVNDIPGLPENAEISDLKRIVSASIEPYRSKPIENLNNPVSADSLRKQLIYVIKTLDSKENNCPQILLFKALLWHYLSALDVDSAFSKCNSITKKLVASHPEFGEAAWLQSLNLIQNGQYFSGLKKLDSISSSGAVKSPHIMSDYYNLVLSIFLPEITAGFDSSVQLFPSARRYSLTPLEQEESLPQDQFWHSVSNKEKGKTSLTFSFGCNFLLRKEFPLNFYSGPSSDHPLLSLEVNKELLGKVRGPLVFDAEETPWKAEMKIIVDISESRTSLNEYMFNLAFNRFDAIEETNDARRIGGKSMRCYNRSPFRNIPGDYYAFIAFDMPIGRYDKNHNNKKPSYESKHMTARYLVCMKTKRCVENKAEEILEMVLSRFN